MSNENDTKEEVISSTENMEVTKKEFRLNRKTRRNLLHKKKSNNKKPTKYDPTVTYRQIAERLVGRKITDKFVSVYTGVEVR